MWTQRIEGAKSNVEVWQALLAVRTLVLPPEEDIETWLKFASLCRKSGRINQARSTLVKLLHHDPEITPENVRYHGPPQVMLAYLKFQCSLGEDSKRREAFVRLQWTLSPRLVEESIKANSKGVDGSLQAEVTMMKLNEEKHTYNKENDMLKKELEALKRKSNAKVQKGFPLLFVCMVAIVGVAVGYYIQL